MCTVIQSGADPAGFAYSDGLSHRSYPGSLAMNAWLAMQQGLDLQHWFEEQVKTNESSCDVDAGFRV